MAKYNSISNAVRGVQPPITHTFTGECSNSSPGYWAGFSAVAPPGNVVREFTPSETSMWRQDPTKDLHRNWSKIKLSGVISMTPLSVGKITNINHVVQREYRSRSWGFAWWTCYGTLQKHTGLISRDSAWTQNDHIGSLSSLINVGGDSDSFSSFEDQIQTAIHSTQSAAFAASQSSFDVLTELAEGRETIGFMLGKVQEAANAFKRAADENPVAWAKARSLNAKQLTKSTDKALRRLGGRWMEYRYAIMPIIYAIKDVNDLLGKRSEVYKTDRDRSKISVSWGKPGTLPDVCLYETGIWDAEVKSTVKSAYNRGALQRVLALSAFNPFKTAWELIPLSFVVDWFLNVGDIITSFTSIDLSSQKVCCTSVKRTWSKKTYLYDHSSDVRTYTRAADTYNPAYNERYEFKRNVDALLTEVTGETYDRFIWTKPTPKLTFDPYLNWKRFMDSLVLVYQPTRKILRSL